MGEKKSHLRMSDQTFYVYHIRNRFGSSRVHDEEGHRQSFELMQ